MDTIRIQASGELFVSSRACIGRSGRHSASAPDETPGLTRSELRRLRTDAPSVPVRTVGATRATETWPCGCSGGTAHASEEARCTCTILGPSASAT